MVENLVSDHKHFPIDSTVKSLRKEGPGPELYSPIRNFSAKIAISMLDGSEWIRIETLFFGSNLLNSQVQLPKGANPKPRIADPDLTFE
jgi:hypothetical protein